MAPAHMARPMNLLASLRQRLLGGVCVAKLASEEGLVRAHAYGLLWPTSGHGNTEKCLMGAE
eukprot:scaffold224689_cov22-Tisochrysis_lutea.AAC.1